MYLKSRDWVSYQEIGFDIKRLIHAFKRLGNLLECHQYCESLAQLKNEKSIPIPESQNKSNPDAEGGGLDLFWLEGRGMDLFNLIFSNFLD